MKRYLWLYIFCLVTSATFSATESQWPKVVQELTDSDFTPVLATNRPEGVSLYAKEYETKAEQAKRIIHIASVHLSKATGDELIVEADDGGSAGTYHDIYQKQNGTYVCIGNLLAGFGIKLLVPYGGYAQIEYWSRGGGGYYARQLYRFIHGEYRCIRVDEFYGYEDTYLNTSKPDE